jgi:hypothetical protein
MNASRFTRQLRFVAAVGLSAAPALLIFPAWIFPPGFLLLNAARDRAGLPMGAVCLQRCVFLSLLAAQFYHSIKKQIAAIVSSNP